MTNTIKLSKLLFAEQKETISYTAPMFALFELTPGEELLLVNAPKLLAHVQEKQQNKNAAVDIEGIAAGMISVRESENQCLGALQVEYVASSPNYPGAGSLMYALASKQFDAPLTSDREHSSSDSSKKTWSRIEQSPEWKKVSELDNYAPGYGKSRTYVRFDGHWPNRFHRVAPPLTPERDVDDCPLPTKKAPFMGPEKAAGLLGTSGAYRYIGPVQAKPLIDHGNRLLEHFKKIAPNFIIGAFLATLHDQLFRGRYMGVAG